MVIVTQKSKVCSQQSEAQSNTWLRFLFEPKAILQQEMAEAGSEARMTLLLQVSAFKKKEFFVMFFSGESNEVYSQQRSHSAILLIQMLVSPRDTLRNNVQPDPLLLHSSFKLAHIK